MWVQGSGFMVQGFGFRVERWGPLRYGEVLKNRRDKTRVHVKGIHACLFHGIELFALNGDGSVDVHHQMTHHAE